MVLKRLRRFLFAFCLSCTVGGLIYFYDTRSVQIDRLENALQNSRQFAVMIENSLPSNVKENSQSNIPANTQSDAKDAESLNATVKATMQKIDSQWTEVEVIRDSGLTQGAERYRMHRKTRTFEYDKNIEKLGDLGIRIKVHLKYLGLFGIRSPSLSNAVGGLIFILIFFTFLVLVGEGEATEGGNEKWEGSSANFELYAGHIASEDKKDSGAKAHLSISPVDISPVVEKIPNVLLKIAQDVKTISKLLQSLGDEFANHPAGVEMQNVTQQLIHSMKEIVECMKQVKANQVPESVEEVKSDQVSDTNAA